MAAYKPEILTSQPVYNVAENSNGNTHVFKGKELIEAILNIVWCKRKSEIQDGGSQTRVFLVGESPS